MATPTTEAPTPEAGGCSTSSSSDLVHTSTHSEPEDIGWGDDDAGLTQVEQHPDVQPDSDDSDSINDLGLILRESLTISEVSRAIFRPYSRTKVHSANKPDRSFIFPKVHSNGCHRSFQQKWLDRLVYNKEVDGDFCKIHAFQHSSKQQRRFEKTINIDFWVEFQFFVYCPRTRILLCTYAKHVKKKHHTTVKYTYWQKGGTNTSGHAQTAHALIQ